MELPGLHTAQTIRISAMSMTHHSGIGQIGNLSSRTFSLFCTWAASFRWTPRNRNESSAIGSSCPRAIARARFIPRSPRGFFPADMLRTFMNLLSKLNGHPYRNQLPGVEANTGPLGHGLVDILKYHVRRRVDVYAISARTLSFTGSL